MAQLSKLEQRYIDLSNELISIFAKGTGSAYVDRDIIQYKPGTIVKINELISRRMEVSDLINGEIGNNARNKTQKEEEINADTTGVVGESDSR